MTAYDPEPLLRDLTQRPGVYCMIDASGVIVYVGKARNLRRRVTSYFRGKAHDAKTIAMLRTLADVEVTVTRTETEALMLEYNLIKQHQPRFNVMLRDDKSYPYIRIDTDHPYGIDVLAAQRLDHEVGADVAGTDECCVNCHVHISICI